MQSFWQDMKYAVRSLRNSPGFAIIAVVTLGLGMAVNTTVFSVINGLLLRSLPVPHAEQITVLAMKQPVAEGFQSHIRISRIFVAKRRHRVKCSATAQHWLA